MVEYSDFERVDVRVGRIVKAEEFPQARKPAYKLMIDFGPEIGVKRSSAQLTENYGLSGLEGKLVMGVVNFPPKQIGPYISECLTLGFADADGKVVLASPDKDVPLGARMYKGELI
jgi:tRNA-binding protein